jgi:hypothetical protein
MTETTQTATFQTKEIFPHFRHSLLQIITLNRRTMKIERKIGEPMLCFTSAVEVSGISPVQNVRHVTGPYHPVPHPPGVPTPLVRLL